MSAYSDDVLLGVVAIDRKSLEKMVDKTIAYYNYCKGDEGELTLEECASVTVFNETLLGPECNGAIGDFREDYGQKLLSEKVIRLAKERLEKGNRADTITVIRSLFGFLHWNEAETKAIEGFNKRFTTGFMEHAADLIEHGMTEEILDYCDVPEDLKAKWREHCRNAIPNLLKKC